jgi:hypothetical protein
MTPSFDAANATHIQAIVPNAKVPMQILDKIPTKNPPTQIGIGADGLTPINFQGRSNPVRSGGKPKKVGEEKMPKTSDSSTPSKELTRKNARQFKLIAGEATEDLQKSRRTALVLLKPSPGASAQSKTEEKATELNEFDYHISKCTEAIKQLKADRPNILREINNSTLSEDQKMQQMDNFEQKIIDLEEKRFDLVKRKNAFKT